MLTFLFVASILATALCSDEYDFPPGIRFFFMKNGFDFYFNSANPNIKDRINGLALQDIDFDQLGAQFSLHDAVISNFNFSASSDFEPAYYINMHFNDMKMDINGKYSMKDLNNINTSGDMQILMKNGSVEMRVEAGEDPNNPGHISLAILSLEVELGKFQINLLNADADRIEFFIDVLEPIFEGLLENQVSDVVRKTIEYLLDSFEDLFPVTHPIDDYVTLVTELVPEKARHQAEGKYYSDNHFNSYSHEVSANAHELADFGISNYHSVDMTGYFSPTVDSTYSIYVEYNQRMQVDLVSESGTQTRGALEMHNPGMCWVQTQREIFDCVPMGPSYSMPQIRIRYQSGCGGGDFHILMRDCGMDGNTNSDYEEIPGLWLYNTNKYPTADEPIIIDNDHPAPGYIAVASSFRYVPTVGSAPTLVAHELPPSPLTNIDMFQVALDDSSLTSAIQARVKSGALEDIYFTGKNVTSSNKIISKLFVTNTWYRFFDGLSTSFPNTELGIGLYSTYKDHIFSVGVNAKGEEIEGMIYAGDMVLQFYVLGKNGKMGTHLFDVSFSHGTKTNFVAHQGEDTYVEIKYGVMSLISMDHYAIYPTLTAQDDMNVLIPYMNIFFNDTLIPLLNSSMAVRYDIDLPEGVEVNSLNIDYKERYLYLHYNLDYTN